MIHMKIQILVTGSHFTGLGFRALEPVIKELVSCAKKEIQVAAYIFSSAALEFLTLLENALARGVMVTVIVNSLNKQPQSIRDFLLNLEKKYPFARIVDFHDPFGGQLHAKILVVDRKKAVVGSANFTWGGLVTNHEICVLIEGKTALDIAFLLDQISRISKQYNRSIRKGTSYNLR